MFFKAVKASKIGQLRLPFGDEWSPAPIRAFDRDVAAQEALTFGLERHPLERQVAVEWRNYKVTAGRAYLDGYRICLSAHLLNTYERVRETFLHEFAHLVAFERWGRGIKPHGPEWRRVMGSLGLTPDATHSYECTIKRRARPFSFRCEACGEILTRTRPLKPRRIYRHVGCGGRIRGVQA